MRWLLSIGLCLPYAALAVPWSFGEPVTVAGANDPPHYHHLDGAGRKHLAASDSAVALVWEDDRSGAPQVYRAIKGLTDSSFSRAHQLSTGEEAYEPAIVAIDAQRWVVAWEQDGAIYGSVIGLTGVGSVQRLADKGSRQVTLASDGSERVAAIWARGHGRGQVIEWSMLRVDGRELQAGPVAAVTRVGDHPFQAYPAASWVRNRGLVIAWEDRRAGHTRLFHTWREAKQSFAAERQLNEHNAPSQSTEPPVGLGSGVMRVTLANNSAGAVQAVWLDKRNPSSGYAVWGARSEDGGKTFGPNRQVQDELGGTVPQWHASVAAGPQGFVAVWDDTREGWDEPSETGDVVLSWDTGKGWSEDLTVPGASGEGYQGSSALTLDRRGDLHLVWIERDDLTSPTRLRYLHGRAAAPQ